MHCVTILYRMSANERFDVPYYAERHLPQALGTLYRHFGVKPLRVELLEAVPGPMTEPGQRLACNIYFASRNDATSLFRLREEVQAGRITLPIDLAIDRFSDVDPTTWVSCVTTLEPERLIAAEQVATAECARHAAEPTDR